MTSDNTTGNNKDSFLDNLREAGQAWVDAGSRLGDVVSDFAGRFKDGTGAEHSSGAHAKPDPVTEEKSTTGRFRAAAREASDRLGSVRNTDDLKHATGNFAAHAEDIIRDVAGNVRRAASETRDSDAATEARSALSTAIGSVRDSFDEAVDSVQERRRNTGDTSAGADSMIADLRARLDDLISRAGSLARNDDEPAAADAGSGTDPDIIDGELISEDKPGDRDDNEKDN